MSPVTVPIAPAPGPGTAVPAGHVPPRVVNTTLA